MKWLVRTLLLSVVLFVLLYITTDHFCEYTDIRKKYKAMDDIEVTAITNDDTRLKNYAGKILNDARELGFVPVGIYGKPNSLRRSLKMINKSKGLKYVHFFPSVHILNSDSYAALLNIMILPRTASDELINAVHSLVSYDMYIEPGLTAEELRKRVHAYTVDSLCRRSITHRGILLGLNPCQYLTEKQVHIVMDRMFQFISPESLNVSEQALPGHEPPKNTIELFDITALFRLLFSFHQPRTVYAKLSLDYPVHYAIFESIVRKSRIDDVLLSEIYKVFNKGTRYDSTDPYSITGNLWFYELDNPSVILDTGSKVYNPLNMTLYISGKKSIKDILGNSDSLATMLPKLTENNTNTSTSGLDMRYAAEKGRWRDVYRNNTTRPQLLDVLKVDVLPEYVFPSINTGTRSHVTDETSSEVKNQLPAIGVMYVFNTHFTNRPLLYGPVFKYIIKVIFGSIDICAGLLADIPKASGSYIHTGKSLTKACEEGIVSVTANCEFDYPSLLFTFYGIIYEPAEYSNEMYTHGVARELRHAVKTVLEASTNSGYEFWKAVASLDNGLSGGLRNLLERSYFRSLDNYEKVEPEFLRDIASTESMGYSIVDDICDEVESYIDVIVKENDGSVFKFLSGLFTNNDSSNPDVTTASIVVLKYDHMNINEETVRIYDRRGKNREFAQKCESAGVVGNIVDNAKSSIASSAKIILHPSEVEDAVASPG